MLLEKKMEKFPYGVDGLGSAVCHLTAEISSHMKPLMHVVMYFF